MDIFIKEHGKFLIDVVVVGVMFTLLLTGVFTSKSGIKTKGIIGLIGTEASIKNQDLTEQRKGSEIVEKETNIQCLMPVVEKKEIDVSSLFSASTNDGQNVPVSICQIKDSNNINVLNTPVATIKNNKLTINSAGKYLFCLKTPLNQNTETFQIYVSGSTEESER